MFSLILWGSVYLAALSLVIMLILIVRRYIYKYIDKRNEKRIAILKPMLFSCMDDLDLCEGMKIKMQKSDKPLLLVIVKQLMEVLRGESYDNLIEVLKKIDAEKEYITQLKSRDENIRADAVINLANFNSDLVKEAISGAMSDKSYVVRFAAAQSLSRLSEKIDLRLFLEMFIRDGAKRPRAMRDFLRKVAPTQISDLINLTTHEDENIAVLSVDGLSQAGDLTVIPTISKLAIGHSSKEVRAASMRTLAALHHPSAEAAVIKALEDKSWEVRAQAAIAAGRIGLEKADVLLAKLLSDTQWWVRFRAAESLYTLGARGIRLIEKAAEKGGVEAEVAELVLLEKSGV